MPRTRRSLAPKNQLSPSKNDRKSASATSDTATANTNAAGISKKTNSRRRQTAGAKKRSVSDRSPAVKSKSRKKSAVEENGFASPGPNMTLSSTEDKENVTPGPTPYWKVAQQRGKLSPRLTRSAKKQPFDNSQVTGSSTEDDDENGVLSVAKGLFSTPPSPSDEERRTMELQKERERDQRFFLSPSRPGAGAGVHASDITSNKNQGGNQLCLEITPGAKGPAKDAIVRASTSSVSSPITFNSSQFDEVKARMHDLEKENASLKAENKILHQNVSKERLGREEDRAKHELLKERLIIDKTKLEGRLDSYENPELRHQQFQEMQSRVQELEGNLGMFKFDMHKKQSDFEHLTQIQSFQKLCAEQKAKLDKLTAGHKKALSLMKKENETKEATLRSEFEARIRAISNERDDAHARVVDCMKELEDTKANLNDATSHEDAISAMQKEFEAKEAILKTKHDQRLRQVSDNFIKDIEEVKSELAEKDERLRSTKAQLDSFDLKAGEKKAQLESELEELCLQHEEDEKRITHLHTQVKTMKHLLLESEGRSGELKDKVGSVGKELERVEEKCSHFEAKIEQLIAENEGCKDKIVALGEKYEHLSQEYLRVKSLLDKANGDLASFENENKALKSDLAIVKSGFEEKELGMAKMLARESELLSKIALQDDVRRSLHNKVIQLSGNIRVFVRVRPCIPTEQSEWKSGSSPFSFPSVFGKENSENCPGLKAGDDLTKRFIVATEPPKDRGGLSQRRKKMKFGFDNVFDPKSCQNDVWKATEPLVQSAVDGYNVCVFAYGQTGSGKTYTMLGGGEKLGLVTNSVKKLFDAKKMLEETSQGATTVNISIELLEIYNEQVRDLMSKKRDGSGFENLNISVNSNEAIGNVIYQASNEEEVSSVLAMAQKRRCVKATKSNEESSRSHLIFTVNFVVQNISGMKRKSKLHICDLAGSERLSKSQAVGSVLNETKHINKSLSTLSNVIEKLQQKSNHVPFRESKLTYLLRNSLGGDSKTLAIVCCNPLPGHFQETTCSLRFAQKLNKVELQAMGNISC